MPTVYRVNSKKETQLVFYVNLHRAVIGPSATLTGRWRSDIDLRRMLTGKPSVVTYTTAYTIKRMFQLRAVFVTMSYWLATFLLHSSVSMRLLTKLSSFLLLYSKILWLSQLYISGVFRYFILFPHRNKWCGYLFRDATNEYPQHLFLWKNKKTINILVKMALPRAVAKSIFLRRCVSVIKSHASYVTSVMLLGLVKIHNVLN